MPAGHLAGNLSPLITLGASLAVDRAIQGNWAPQITFGPSNLVSGPLWASSTPCPPSMWTPSDPCDGVVWEPPEWCNDNHDVLADCFVSASPINTKSVMLWPPSGVSYAKGAVFVPYSQEIGVKPVTAFTQRVCPSPPGRFQRLLLPGSRYRFLHRNPSAVFHNVRPAHYFRHVYN